MKTHVDQLEEFKSQFHEEVFPAEFNEIHLRRKNAGDERPRPDDAVRPTPGTENDLVGLAFSGGGIRSASFCLGVVQHLIKSRLFPRVDYLSTVSGGGFTGACLSALLARNRDGASLLVEREGAAEPPALNHIRNGSNYLLPAGLVNGLRLPAVIVTGALHTLLLFIPPIVFAVLLTEVFFELTGSVLPSARHLVPIAGIAPLFWVLIKRPILTTFRPARGDWESRDRDGQKIGRWLLLAICSLVAVPLLYQLNNLVTSSPQEVFGAIGDWIDQNWGLDGWLFWGLLAGVGLIVLGWIRFRSRMLIALVGAAGPIMILVFYLICCLYNINSPAVTGEKARAFIAAHGEAVPADGASLPSVSNNCPEQHLPDRKNWSCPETVSQDLKDAVASLLIAKRYTAEGTPDVAEAYSICPEDEKLVVLNRCRVDAQVGLFEGFRRKLQASWLTTYREPELHVRVIQSHDDGGLLDRLLSTIGWQGEPFLLIDELTIVPRPVPGGGWVWGHAEWWFYLSGLLLFGFNYFFVNLNGISIHGFYRDRLSRTFLIQGGENGIESADDLKLSELRAPGSVAPYHLVNTALNLQGSNDPQLRERKTAPFLLSKRYCGGHHSGYCSTKRMEERDPGLDLGTAMAISGAAAAPNMGAITMRSLSFVMTMLNIRLNYWLPNPEYVDDWRSHFLAGRPGLRYLLKEALGAPDNKTAFVNCSDGGHIENLGLYELVKRKCKTIICVDGEADPSFSFHGFTTVQRQVEIDFGAKIQISKEDMQSIIPDESGLSGCHGAVGTIDYAGGGQGVFIYLKLSCTGTEPQYVDFYRHLHPAFPHESTSDQFFDETQFEVYRALGEHAAREILASEETQAAIGGGPLET